MRRVTELDVLTEIRDLLQVQQHSPPPAAATLQPPRRRPS